ncbi:LOW QUALITY PROTEIN: Fanconi anemia group M protein-like [Gigantopelta aegis]|uniref:LOW QUALITY PROTEIN: Fanconi anemia group M protein-like n=1 Tax=Gigantopelta aegis TaxID=1735272 RepID=UPI001B8898CA|nr:LOW QUALITY PROTEIN: Fanconi anemia group M protein-like [Gigantopelta aegis]
MSKHKQKTLFQSWGQKSQNETVKESKLSTSKVVGNGLEVVDLCQDDSDDDLLTHALEESMLYVQKENLGEKAISDAPSSSKWRKTCARNSELAQKFGQPSLHTEENSRLFCNYGKLQTVSTSSNFDSGNISLGADDIDVDLLPSSKDLSSLPELPGFDKSAGRLWIYPTNYSVRDYQYNIVKTCLFRNTLVSLPTGLGKTFIAAVVMYNFYRWYPQAKIVFMAPTKPLVAQQIEACYNIMGIPQEDTSEMTGSMNPTERQKAWHSKRVFFLTPQVLTNDLTRGTCPAEGIKCLVFDEAHKALGNHAYCQVVRETIKYTKDVRILALSATPGSDIKAVQQVVTNLLISHIEMRTEECIDIKSYTHERKVDKIVIPLGEELTKIKTKFLQVISVVVSRLVRCGVLYRRDPSSLSKFLLLKSRDMFRQNPPEKLPKGQFGVVEGDFALGMSLYHAYELLQLHGLRSFYNFLTGIVNGEKSFGRTRAELLGNADFSDIMDGLKERFTHNNSPTSNKPPAVTSGHPKLEKLQEIVVEHFRKFQNASDVEMPCSTRVMIFSQYRDSVEEIRDLLNQHYPMVKVMSFIGQSSTGKVSKGFTQKEQLKVMKAFREGGYNTLVSTCVGEEGLDIGDVDLIICFDAHKSPIRLVQRMGRTGRKRKGHIIMLVTEGKEEQIYNQSQYSKKSIHKAILNGAKSLHFYSDSHRMFPEGLTPTCHKMFITVKQQDLSKKMAKCNTNKNRVGTVKTFGISEKKCALEDDGGITREEYEELKNFLLPEAEVKTLPNRCFHCLFGSKENGVDSNQQESTKVELSLTEWLPWQNRQQETRFLGHSLKTKHLVELMEFVELQQSLSAEEDHYGLEMHTYLNNNDILKPGQNEPMGDGILQFCSKKDRNQNVETVTVKIKTKRTSDKSVRPKRSEILPIIKIIGDESDDDLPAFDLGEKLSVVDDKKSILDVEEFISDDTKMKSNTCVPGWKESIASDTDIKSNQNDFGRKESNEINKSKKNVLGGKKSVDNETDQKSKKSVLGPSQNDKCESKMKKLKMNVNRSVIQIIADDDRDDFQDPLVSSEFITDIHETAQNNVFEIMETDDSNPSVLSINDITTNRVMSAMNVEVNATVCPEKYRSLSSHPLGTAGSCRVPSPPSVKELTEVFNILASQTHLPKLDLMQLVSNWTKGNHFEDTNDMLTVDINSVNFDLASVSDESMHSLAEETVPKFTSLKPVIPISLNALDNCNEGVFVLNQSDNVGNRKGAVSLKNNQTLKTSQNSSHFPNVNIHGVMHDFKMDGDLKVLKAENECEEKMSTVFSSDVLDGVILKHSGNGFTKAGIIPKLHAEKGCDVLEGVTSMHSCDELPKNRFMVMSELHAETDTEDNKTIGYSCTFLNSSSLPHSVDGLPTTNIVPKETTDSTTKICSEHKKETTNGDAHSFVDSFFNDDFCDDEFLTPVVETTPQSKASDPVTFTQAMAFINSTPDYTVENETCSDNAGDDLRTDKLDQTKLCKSPVHFSSTVFQGDDEGEANCLQSGEVKDELSKQMVMCDDKSENSILNAGTLHEQKPLNNEDFQDVPVSYVSTSMCDSNANLNQEKTKTFLYSKSKNGVSLETLSLKNESTTGANVADSINFTSSEQNVDVVTPRKSNNPEETCSLEDDFILPMFDLEFDLDDDIIPPSPSVSQTYSKFSFSRSQRALSNKSQKILFSEGKIGESSHSSDDVENHSSPFSPSLLEPHHVCEEEIQLQMPTTPVLDYRCSSKQATVKNSTPTAKTLKMNDTSVISKNVDTLKKKRISPLSLARGKRDILPSPIRHVTPVKRQTSPCESKFSVCETSGRALEDPDDEDSFVIVNRKRKRITVLNSSTESPDQTTGSRLKTPSRPTASKRTSNVQFDTSSDDEFAISKPKQLFGRLHLKPHREHDDFVGEQLRKPTAKRWTASKTSKNKQKQSDFIEYEAVLSGEEGRSSDDDSSGMDFYDDSFVNDNTQMTQHDVDMHAVYLKSVHSPIAKKCKYVEKYPHADVFSQVPPEDDTHYMEDSFCVGDDYEDNVDDTDEEEEVLKWKQHKSKHQKKTKVVKGKKRIRHLTDSSSDEEPTFRVQPSQVEDNAAESRKKSLHALFSSSDEESPVNLSSVNQKLNVKDSVINRMSHLEVMSLRVGHDKTSISKILSNTSVLNRSTSMCMAVDADQSNSSVSRQNLNVNNSSVSRQNLDVNNSSFSRQNLDVRNSTVSRQNLDVNNSSVSRQNLNVNNSSVRKQNLDVNNSSVSKQNLDVNNSSINRQNLDVNNSSINRQNLDVNNSSINRQNLDVNNLSVSRQNLDVNNSSINRQNLNVNNSSVNRQNLDVEAAKRDREERLMKQKLKQDEFRWKMLKHKQSLSVSIEDVGNGQGDCTAECVLDVTSDRQSAQMLNCSEDEALVSETSEDEKTCSTVMLVNPMLSSKTGGRLVVLVDSREISGAQDIVSSLRLQHSFYIVARQITGCDYILSNRLAVDRKQWSDFSNGANRKKLIDRVQRMQSLYDRCCIIVEKDRVKPGEEKSPRACQRSKYNDWTLAFLSQSNVKLLFSDSQGETAALISELCQLEAKKGMNITVPVDLNPQQEQVFQFYTSIPHLNCTQALSLCYHFKTLSEFLKSTSQEISIKGQMSQARADDIYSFIKHKFDLQMLPSKR